MNDSIRALLSQYDGCLQAQEVQIRHWINPVTRREQLEHLRWMIEIMLLSPADLTPVNTTKPISDWSDTKVHRWIGFIQGTLQTLGLVTIRALRDQSRALHP